MNKSFICYYNIMILNIIQLKNTVMHGFSDDILQNNNFRSLKRDSENVVFPKKE